MPLVGSNTATATTTTTAIMDSRPSLASKATMTARPDTLDTDRDSLASSPSTPPSSPITHDFDEAQCLFCNHPSGSLESNLTHMSKTHGLHIDVTHLLVDVPSLLAYFHLIIAVWHECLYCATQRNTHQAAQQHMMAKGHCKYDVASKDAELKEFFDAQAEEEVQRSRNAMREAWDDEDVLRGSSSLQTPRKAPRAARRIDGGRHITTSTSPDVAEQDQDLTTSPPSSSPSQPTTGAELSTRAQKQEQILTTQLSQLRAADRRSLLHLPASQQRALLATYHKQNEKVRRTEQSQRGRLESAGNHFGRLGTTRLVRIPPHFGNVQGLNR